MTLAEFKKKRLAGKFKSPVVNLWIDSEYKVKSENEVVVKSDISLAKFDGRLFYGLPVFIHSENYTKVVQEIYEELKKHTEFIVVALTDFGEDLGWKWTKREGVQEI